MERNADSEAARELRQAYVRLFDCPDGRKVLEDLAGQGFARASTFDPDPCRAAFNQGRRGLYLRVERMLDPDGFGPLDGGRGA
ncbi:hypothetical protein M7784_12750 [Desulfovibrio aminophilus]|jgi:hypothetical protein|uniref:Bbp19 family protein n=1 Tax=Desulfovibrio aminophilus TaxID=81425 RepID=UPI00041CA360|nr:hypothetical protein [Desulfovibrio aminophilus]MCM0756104.1 hypothetical protein [Desulfovibrio aminophilus]